MAIEDDIMQIMDLWHSIEEDTKWELANIWLDREKHKLEVMGAEIERLEDKVIHLLKIIHDSKGDIAEMDKHKKHLLSLIHHVKPTREWQREIQDELNEIAREITMDVKASKEKTKIIVLARRNAYLERRNFSIICNLIESDRNLVQFGVFSRGNVTGNDRSGGGGRGPFRYDPQKKEMIHEEGYSGVIPANVDQGAPDNPPFWEKRLFKFQLETQIIIGVKQEILGREYSQVVSDTRGGNFYCVGIRITYKGIDNYISGSEGNAIIFVNDLFKSHPRQFMELIDRLADRYIPFYNAGIKELEAEWRRETGRR